MDILDQTIANVALPQMAGNLGVSLQEISWVTTGYMLACIIVLPMSAFLSDRFGRKRYLMISILMFTASSLLVGMSQNLMEVTICRILQGAGGGALLVSAQATLIEIFPKKEQGFVQPLYMFAVVAAPVFGPTLGGWITNALTWRWCFLINIPIGLVSVWMLAIFLKDKKRSTAPSPADWTGIVLLTAGLGSLQYVLEEGERSDWFADPLICALAAIAAISISALIYWLSSPRNRYPVVDLSILNNKTLVAGTIMFATIGFSVSGVTYLYSILAQTIQGLTPLEAGLSMLPGGIATAFGIVASGIIFRAPKKAPDPRLFCLSGIFLTVISLWMFGHMTPYSGPDQTKLPLILRGLGLGLFAVPINRVIVMSLRPDEVQQGTAFTRLFQLLGGSFGIAILATNIVCAGQAHRSNLVTTYSAANPVFERQLGTWTGFFMSHSGDIVHARNQAFAVLDLALSRQAQVMSYNDAFLLILVFMVATAPLLALLSRRAGNEKGTR
jgi:DHA2 family multidrug resistance protein